MSLTEQRTEPSAGSGVTGLLWRSSLYREYLAEREEILKHKWYESERAGRDIGFEAARVSWRVHHGLRWRKARASWCGVTAN